MEGWDARCGEELLQREGTSDAHVYVYVCVVGSLVS